MKNLWQISRSLQKFGYRLTPQRIAIYNYLVDSRAHPTANQVYDELKKEFPSLSLATVYNTLEMFTKIGFVNELGSIGDGKIHYDANSEPHVNIACVSCHQILDIPSEHVAQLMSEITQAKGYNILGSRIMVYGICSVCQENQKPGKTIST